jgi:hypothetical protein
MIARGIGRLRPPGDPVILASVAADRPGRVLAAVFQKRASQLPNRKRSPRRSTGPKGGVDVRRTADGRGWVFVHPRCARDRAEDLEEVRMMVEAGELDVAVDELRWLLSGCSDFIEAHALLGELALAAGNDVPLARGHFGIAVQLGLKALDRSRAKGPLPCREPANASFYIAGRGLAWCLAKLDLRPKAEELVAKLVALDRSDPLEIGKVLSEIDAPKLPVVDLLSEFPRGEEPPTGDV